jgi:anaerobic magnesium-protoporphyrin IX monomethyl ester cyclase
MHTKFQLPLKDDNPSLNGIHILIIFQSFKNNTDTLAFVKNVRHLGIVSPTILFYTGGSLERAGATIHFLDCSALNLDSEDAVKYAKKWNFDLVCFTITNLDFLFTAKWIQRFYEEFNKPIFVGGIAAENYPEEVAKVPGITGVCHAPAETAAVEWVKRYFNKGEWWLTPGTTNEYQEAVIKNPVVIDTRKLIRPHPARHLGQTEKYFSILAKGAPSTAGMATFGCPFGCEFCQIRRTPFVIRTAIDLVDELEICEKELGIAEMDYFDSNFTVPRERVFEFSRLYQQRKLKIRWSCRARIDLVDKEVLKAMKKANCSWIGFGIESGDDTVLSNIKKTQKGSGYISKALKWTDDAGISPVGFFVFGLPGETNETLENTIRLIEKNPLDFIQIQAFYPVPNTPIYNRIVQETGLDIWKLAITQGHNRDDLELDQTGFTVKDMHQYVSKVYTDFYFRPHQILNMARNATSVSQFKNFFNAGLDVFKGAVLGNLK